MQKMSVTRGLVEMKRFDERILQSVVNSQFVAVSVGLDAVKKVQGSNLTVSEVEAKIQGSFDKVQALIDNRSKLKAAIVKSNALTQVTILGRTMSVAEAIELKSTVTSREQYLHQLSNQFTAAKRLVETQNDALTKKIDTLITATLGSDKKEVTKEMYEMIAGPQRKNSEHALIDPCQIEKKIDAVREEISQLKSEIDFVLSESNARTEIEVEI